MTGPQAPPGKRIGPAEDRPDRLEATGGGKSLTDTVTAPAHTAMFSTPCMATYGIEPVDCIVDKNGLPSVAVQEMVSALIIATEARSAVAEAHTAVSLSSRRKPAKAEVVCARPSCRNRFTPRRKDQHTCGTARCRQWWSRQQRTRNVTVATGWGGGGGDTGNREYAPANTGAVEANCDSPTVAGGVL